MAQGFNSLVDEPKPATTALDQTGRGDCNSLHTGSERTLPPCHVLFVIDELCEIGGAERVLFQIIRSLPPRLFRRTLLTFRVHKEADLTQIGCPIVILPLSKTYDWNACKVAWEIRRFVKQEKVSIVHTFFETSDLWAGPIAKLSGCPILVSSRRDLGILRSRKHRAAYKLLRGMYDAVLTVSPQVRDFCVRQDGLKPSKVRTLFNGVNLHAIAAAVPPPFMRRELAIPETVPVIMTVGNIRRVKGIDILLKTAEIVCRKRPDALFLVVGRRSEQDYCRELEKGIAATGLASNFRMLGGREDIFSLLRMSDIFCLPSRSEGFSNALIEAMACGLPCVATDVGGNREVLAHGETGLLVPNENYEDLASALLNLLSNPCLAQGMGARAEKIVRTRFTTEAMIANLTNIYTDLLAARGRH